MATPPGSPFLPGRQTGPRLPRVPLGQGFPPFTTPGRDGDRPTFPMPQRPHVSRATMGTGRGGGPDLPEIGDLPEYELPEMGE